MQNPTADTALEICLLLLETARTGHALTGEQIDGLLHVLVRNHALGEDLESVHLRERLVARMSLEASAKVKAQQEVAARET